VVPNLSVALAVVLGVTSVLAVIAFINHSAHAMDVSEILDVVTNEALGAVDDTWPERAGSPSTPSLPLASPELGVDPSVFAARADGFHVRFDRDGWVQYVDAEALALAVPDGSVVRFESAAGRYAVAGTPMCSVWPCPDDPDEATRSLRRAVGTGAARTLAQDAAYGIRQLVDVALKALSPGVNDPTTAQDAIVHLGTVLAELLRRDPPPRRCRIRGRTVLFPELPDHEDLIELAFGELRRAAAPYPAVCGYLWATIDQLIRAGDDRLAPGTVEMLRAHGRRVLATAERSGLADDDRADLQRAYERRLASPATAPSPA
jgi:uncharacterized membrane protein